MPKDMFWKFNFWSKEKAFAVLGEIADKIFSEMMKVDESSTLTLVDADPEKAKFTLRFEECYECAGLENARSGACCYHAGMFAGIFSSLLGQDFDAYETDCHAVGKENCLFVLGLRENEEISSSLSKYLSPPAASTDVEALSFMERQLDGVEKNSNIIVDTFSFFLEISENPDKIRRLMNSIYEATNKTNGITILYMLKDTHPKDLERTIINMCDVVFMLETRESGSEIETLISIPKIRGVVSPNKRVKVLIGERIQIDTAREIA